MQRSLLAPNTYCTHIFQFINFVCINLALYLFNLSLCCLLIATVALESQLAARSSRLSALGHNASVAMGY